jgi:hypothetical protein
MAAFSSRDAIGVFVMIATGDAGHEPPVDSIVTPLRFSGEDGPKAIVIGPTHPPYFVFPDGRTEWASPEAQDEI